ncbi:MAG: insulinase family protein [Bacteroidales bacterium]|nr:insulinase family protein [Bacteroidales bacterium]
MIEFSRHTLGNGLRLLVHEDRSSPLVAFNLLYDAGSRDEDETMTGMAHLFEHLMFGGTEAIPDFDTPLQIAGGENNAFTKCDITNYYITVPARNIETAFWLESDRMRGLDLSQRSLDTQKKVVTEEFRQRYLNQPYGDAILRLRALAYKVHPYRWPAIGLDPSHIERASLDTVREFYNLHYAPNNAILTLAGNISTAEAYSLALKWFGDIEASPARIRKLPVEPQQSEPRRLTTESEVPSDAVYRVWHTCGRNEPDFHTLDLITDLLAGGESGRLNRILAREKKMFSDINAYVTSDIDPGLLIVNGKLMKGVDPEEALSGIEDVIRSLSGIRSDDYEFEKVRNRFESSVVFQNTSILNKAMNLSYYELLGDASKINREVEMYRNVSASDVEACLARYLTEKNSATLVYRSAIK